MHERQNLSPTRRIWGVDASKCDRIFQFWKNSTYPPFHPRGLHFEGIRSHGTGNNTKMFGDHRPQREVTGSKFDCCPCLIQKTHSQIPIIFKSENWAKNSHRFWIFFRKCNLDGNILRVDTSQLTPAPFVVREWEWSHSEA